VARRVFLSYQHRDHGRAKGFNLMRYAPNLKLEFSVRHLLKPVDSTRDVYVGSEIRKQMKGTSVTVVLIGKGTAASDWVRREIKWSLEKRPANGLLGIVIDPDAKIPAEFRDYGADVIDWTDPADVGQFEAAIEQAALRAGRGEAIAAGAGTSSSGSCNR
jgi:Thoeris protein ThsB, TIR-like domain